jgi:ATP:ADP antiporter, AAA family
MKVHSGILKIMNIRPEEAKAVFLLIAFSFFTGLTLSFYFTASNAIFLKHFNPSMIPVSFIASGFLIYLAWLTFSAIDRKLSFPAQVHIKLIFIFLTVLAISIGVYILNNSWLIFIMYTWVRIVVYITLVTFWGIAGKLFNIRQGKRIFGLIGIGEVISIMIGYFSIPLILNFLKATHLLFLSSGTLLLCFIMALIILHTFKDQLAEAKGTLKTAATKKEPETSYWKLIKQPYFMLISLMALLPIFGYLFVDFLFLSQTKIEFANNPETIAGFFGVFLGFVAVIELIFKLISGRFLNKYGLKPSLISLPVILSASILIAAIFGSIYGAVGLFFAFILMARLFERSVRSAFYEPAFQLLYQPVPPKQRLIFQNQIEGIPKALGTVITGVVILLFSTIHSFNLIHYNWFFILALALWIWVSIKMYEAYRNMLKSKLNELKSEKSTHIHSINEIFTQKLKNATEDSFNQIFNICETAKPVLAEETLINIFEEAPEAIKFIILKKMSELQMVNAIGFLKSQISKTHSVKLNAMIQSTIEELEFAESIHFEEIAGLCKSPESNDRMKAARLLGSSGRYNTIKLLHILKKDADFDVKRAVIIASGKIKRYELWQFITENLSDPDFACASMIAIQQIGEPIFTELEHLFEKSNAQIEVQIRILKIYEFIEGPKSIKLLRDKIHFPNKDVARQALVSLSNRKYKANASEAPALKIMIEESVEYILWILATLQDLSTYILAFDLKMALLAELEGQKEHVFLLLSLLYDMKTIHHIREHIESKDPNAKVYALEIGDMLISDDIKEIFFPVFEDLPIQERLNRFSYRFPQEKMEPVGRIYDILNKEYSLTSRYTKACAISLLADTEQLENMQTEKILSANLVHPDILLSEISAWTLFQYNNAYYEDIMLRLRKTGNRKILETEKTIKARSENKAILLFEKIAILKGTEIFSTVPETEIIGFLNMFPKIRFEKDMNIENHVDQLAHTAYLKSDNGIVIAFPLTALYEFMTNTAVQTEKLLSINQIQTIN